MDSLHIESISGVQTRSQQRAALRSSPFTHMSLNQTKQEIRLCRILRHAEGDSNEIISCEITHHVLGEVPSDQEPCPPYVAASYCWGDGKERQPILVNGGHLEIGKNLHDLLRVLRDKADSEMSCYWIDQLCIDQSSTEERNHQVQLMSSVYTQASAVYAWLGENSPGAREACEFLEELNHIGTTHPEDDWSGIQGALQRLLNNTTLQSKKQIFNFFTQEYWKRIWIVQEIFLARELFLLCGQICQQMQAANIWRSFMHGSVFMAQIEAASSPPHEQLLEDQRYLFRESFYLLARRATALQAPEDSDSRWLPPLATVMSDYARECTVPLDQVFGYQACRHPDQRIVIDYSDSPGTVLLKEYVQIFPRDDWKWKRLAVRLGVQGASDAKLSALWTIADRLGLSRVLEVARSEGLCLDSRDPQHEVCERLMKLSRN